MPPGEPQIPLKIAELVFVAFSTVVDYLELETEYPTHNMQRIAKDYKSSRDQVLQLRGYTQDAINNYTAAAVEKLTSWLDEQAARTESAEGDFDIWKEELANGD